VTGPTARYGPGEVVERTGLTHDTLRYYEREGLVGPVHRTAGGQRVYDDDDLGWIGVVTCLREAGLGIADLRRFTELLRSEGEPEDRVSFLKRRRIELQERITKTQQAIDVLDSKIAHYSNPER